MGETKLGERCYGCVIASQYSLAEVHIIGWNQDLLGKVLVIFNLKKVPEALLNSMLEEVYV